MTQIDALMEARRVLQFNSSGGSGRKNIDARIVIGRMIDKLIHKQLRDELRRNARFMAKCRLGGKR